VKVVDSDADTDPEEGCLSAMTSPPPAIVFCMPLRGHFQRLRSIIAGLADQGVPVHVFTDRAFAPAVERAGGRFVDLFAGRPLDSVDATSMPMPCRFVSFAGYCADAVAREVAALRPGVIIHDTFAVIGWAVANELGVPRVNVCAAHNAAPAPTLARLQRDPRVAIAPVCHDAARRSARAPRHRRCESLLVRDGGQS
jgi:UDP:flavonoid glycosyltransferase YjiC (YdhE family)